MGDSEASCAGGGKEMIAPWVRPKVSAVPTFVWHPLGDPAASQRKEELNQETPSTPAIVVAHKPSKLDNKVRDRDLA